jgi:hypothetical protein
MRRALTILLIAFFAAGPLAAALPAGGEARLPACCRRGGAHHCASAARMANLVSAASTPAFTAPATCPAYPGAAAALLAPADALTTAAASPPVHGTRPLEFASEPSAVSSHLRCSHAGRGPPDRI